MIDLIAQVERIPRLGETCVADGFRIGFGGKGANQAVMASRLGARVALVAALGKDHFGDVTVENLVANGVDIAHIHRVQDLPSGVAPITVQRDGQNIVLIAPGANQGLSESVVTASAAPIRQTRVVVCQLEVPVAAVKAAFVIAHDAGATTVLNPAPAIPVPPALLELADYVVPNETELENLTGSRLESMDDITSAATSLISRPDQTVVVTLGARGALVCSLKGTSHFSAPSKTALDTTGAGDAFIGAFSAMLAWGASLASAVELACAVASESVERPGTQTSFPHRTELTSRGLELPGGAQ